MSILPLLPTSTVGVKRIGASTWRSTSRSPGVTYSFRLLRPKYCVFFLAALDGTLRPVLHFDCGNGSNGHDGRQLACSSAGVYILCLSELPDVVRIRLDLGAGASRFRLWARAAYTGRGLEGLIGRTIRRSRPGSKGAPATYDVIGGDDGGKTAIPRRKQRFRGVADHYLKVLTAAAMTPGWPQASTSGSTEAHLSFVVPVYNTPTRYLDDLYASFRAQSEGVAELVLSDDGSTREETRAWLTKHASTPFVKIVDNGENRGIAATTNAGIAAARGQWIGLVDHDDALSPFAVPRIMDALSRNPDVRFLYTDEVITDDTLAPVAYHLKPAYDPVLLSGVNYINHLSLYRRDRLLRVGGLRLEFEGSQDYDLLLRYLADLAPREIRHLPFPAYLWRRHEQSFSATSMTRAVASARRALGERYGSTHTPLGVGAAVESTLHRVRFDTAFKTWPKISIVIPSRDSYELIARLIDQLMAKTDYPDYEIIVVDNGTTDPRVLRVYERARARYPAFCVEIRAAPFNFSRQVNRGVSLATGAHVLLLNNDIEIVEPQWLREMVSCFAYAGTGIVGARLLYPDRTLQHAGVIVGMSGLAGHWYHAKPEDHPGMMGRLNVRQSLSAVTAACMLISRACLDEIGPFDETAFRVAYNDVDYCLRAIGRGYRVVWTPFAKLIHHESVSRGSDETPANIERFRGEKDALLRRYGTDTFEDPAFSPWFSRDHSDPRLILLDRLPEPR